MYVFFIAGAQSTTIDPLSRDVMYGMYRKKLDYSKLISTPDRLQSKMLLTIDERGSKIARNSVFDCHLSPVGRQMAIENSVSNFF